MSTRFLSSNALRLAAGPRGLSFRKKRRFFASLKNGDDILNALCDSRAEIILLANWRPSSRGVTGRQVNPSLDLGLVLALASSMLF
jgi:hypothetical protein